VCCELRPILLDPPAEILADLYRHRWSIELFFCFFEHVLGCRHLLSHSQAGIEIQTYCAIIACLLLALWTGGKPTLRTLEMVCLYLQGWAATSSAMKCKQRRRWDGPANAMVNC